jgi:hypothetical protein
MLLMAHPHTTSLLYCDYRQISRPLQAAATVLVRRVPRMGREVQLA